MAENLGPKAALRVCRQIRNGFVSGAGDTTAGSLMPRLNQCGLYGAGNFIARLLATA